VIVALCLSLFSPLFAMRRSWVRIPSRPPNLKGDLERASWEQPLRPGKEKIRFVWLLRRIAVRETLVDAG
jgi:hypothetical protein